MIKRVIAPISYLTIFIAVLIIIYVTLANHSIWFEYVSVEPTKEAYTTEEPLTMISYMERKRKNLTLEFYDVLRCQESGRLVPQIDEGVYTDKKPLSQSKWIFRGTIEGNNIPSVPDICVMESTITYKVFGVIKSSQNVISSKFKIQ